MSQGRAIITVTVRYSRNDHGEAGRRVSAALAASIRGAVARLQALIDGTPDVGRIFEITVEETEE